MAIFKAPEASGASFSLFKDEIKDDVCPPGQYPAKCVGIKEEYEVKVQKFQSDEYELQDRIAFLFECYGDDGNSLIDTRPMKISGHEKSALFQFLKGWLGKAPSYGMDTEDLKGHPALITVAEATSKTNKVYTRIESVVPLPKAMLMMFNKEVDPPAAEAKPKGKAKPAAEEIPF